jgi:hypothetical protein
MDAQPTSSAAVMESALARRDLCNFHVFVTPGRAAMAAA